MKTVKNLVFTSIILVAGVMVGVLAAPNLGKLNISQLLGTTETAVTDTTGAQQLAAIQTNSTNPADLNDLTPAAGDDAKAPETTEVKAEEVKDDSAATPPSNFGPKADGSLSADATTSAEPEMTKIDLAQKAANTKTAAGFDLDAALADRVLGDADAPVTLYEYSSLSCPHCMHFHLDFLPTIKKELIDTGKVKLIFRGFPLNEPALRAEMLARCAPPEQYYNMLQMFFESQETWATAENPVNTLRQMVKIAGFDDAKVDACLNNAELEAGIVELAQKGTETYGIDATPAFIADNGRDAPEISKGLGILNTMVDQLKASHARAIEVKKDKAKPTADKTTTTKAE